LPVLDWKSIHESGADWAAWLARAEFPEHRERMEAILAGLTLTRSAAARLAAIHRPVHVVAIAEDWCGDVVRHAPVLRGVEQACPSMTVRFITREQRPDVFARFLTNGGEAIPKFVFLSEAWVECGNWGPMANDLRAIISRGKACGDLGAARKKTNALYELDSDYAQVVGELADLAEIASCEAP
jgi:hypothetical protein